MVRGHSGSPDLIRILTAAGALGAVIFNLRKSAETGTNIGAMLGGLGEGAVKAFGRMVSISIRLLVPRPGAAFFYVLGLI